MKISKKYKYLLSLATLSFLVAMCMTIEDVIHPDDPQVNSDIDISVKIKIVAETDGNSKLVFGILMPKSWDAANNASMTLTTTAAYAPNAVTNEVMTLTVANNPSDGQPWASSFQSRFGLLGNTGPVEWVVFESATTFVINDNNADQTEVNGTVKIKIRTGERAIRFFAGYTFCGAAFGFDGNKYPDENVVVSKVLEINGGDESLLDYTIEPQISFVPSTFGYADIFAIKYNEPHLLTEGGLKEQKVYLLGKIAYEENGTIKQKVVDEISDKTLMEELGDQGEVTSWQKYVYLKSFFDLPNNAEIVNLEVYFTNADKSIVIVDEETDEDFIVVETCE